MKRIIKFFGIIFSIYILASCNFFVDSVDERYNYIPVTAPVNEGGNLSVKVTPSIPVAFGSDSSTRSASPIKTPDEEKAYFSQFKYAAEFYTVSGGIETKITGLCAASKIESATALSFVFSFFGFVHPVDRSLRLKIYGFKDPDIELPSGNVYSIPEYILFSQVDVDVPANSNYVEISDKIVFLPGNDTSISADSKISLAIKFPAEADSLSYKTGEESFKTTGVTAISAGVKKIEVGGLAPGAHEYTFLVTNSSKPLYMWTETIYVYYGLTTSSWNTGTTCTEGSYICRDVSTFVFTTFYARADNGVTSHAALWDVFDVENVDAPGYVPDGSMIKPFNNLQDAVDRILLVNDGISEYILYVDGQFEAPFRTTSMIVITDSNLTKDLNLKIIGMGINQDKTEFYCKEYQGINGWSGSGSANARAVQVGTTSAGITKKLLLTLKNVDIKNGGATKKYDNDGYGGGVFFNGNADSRFVLDAVEITGCKATFGGGCYFTKGSFVLQNGTIIGDKNITSAVKATDLNSFSPNAAIKTSTPGCGGGIYATGSDTSVAIKKGCKVTGNYIDNGSGGGIYVADGASVSIGETTYITNNSCSVNGGGIFVTGNNSKLTFGSSITGNKAAAGGGIYIDASASATEPLYFGNSSITAGNVKDLDIIEKNYGGDVVNLKNKYMRISSSYKTPEENAAELNNAIEILGSKFTNGGSMYIGKYGDANSTDPTFELSEGLKISNSIGGAGQTYKIIASSWTSTPTRISRRVVLDANNRDCVLTIDGTVSGTWTFWGLKLYRGSGTGSDGGGFTMGYNFVEMDYCDIDSCTTTGNGGGISMNDLVLGELKLYNCSITNCSAVNGGGLYMTTPNNLLNNISMSGNTASAYGNGVFVNSQRELKISGDLKFAEDNDIFLSDADGGTVSKVSLQSNLGTGTTVMTISRRVYVSGYQVLGGSNAGLIAANVGNFKLKNSGYCIDGSGKISSYKITDMADDPSYPGVGYYRLSNFISSISHTEEPYIVDFTGYNHLVGPQTLTLDNGQNIKIVSDAPIELKSLGFDIGPNAKVTIGENISLGGDGGKVTVSGGELCLESGGTISATSIRTVALEMTSGKFTMSAGTVMCNHGGIYVTGGEVEITGGNFRCNDSDSSYLPFFNLEGGSGSISNITVDGLYTFSGTDCKHSSSGVTVTGGNWNFNSCTIKNFNNYRGSGRDAFGGGFSITGSGSNVSLTNCMVNDNTVRAVVSENYAYGGGIYAADGCTLTVTGGSISGNTAIGENGATADGSNLFITAGVKYNGTVLASDFVEN